MQHEVAGEMEAEGYEDRGVRVRVIVIGSRQMKYLQLFLQNIY